MPFGSSGSGGGGLTLGPTQNTFGTSLTADKAAAEVLRDAYETANASWLAEYDAEPTFSISLVYGTTTLYQARRGSAWADVTGLVTGPRGLVGSQARFTISQWRLVTTIPATAPTGGSYVVTTGVLTASTNWSTAALTPSATQILVRSDAPINPLIQTGTVTPSWSIPFEDLDEDIADRVEAAQTAAEAAQTAAETAQTNAETAETNAETAETGAETAQGRAEDARDAAETALEGSGAALSFNDLWDGDMDITTANQWKALGTEAVPVKRYLGFFGMVARCPVGLMMGLPLCGHGLTRQIGEH